MDDTGVKIRASKIGPFAEHINSVDPTIKFTREAMRDNIEVYRKPSHTD